MAVTITPYNHTLKRYLSGENAAGDTYKVKLLTAATFNATHTTLAATGGTEVANGNGYTTGGATIANLAATTVSTSGAKLDADDTSWTASGWTASPKPRKRRSAWCPSMKASRAGRERRRGRAAGRSFPPRPSNMCAISKS